MRSCVVIIGAPASKRDAGLSQRREQRLVQQFIPEPTVDGEDGPAPSALAIYWRWTNPLTGAIHQWKPRQLGWTFRSTYFTSMQLIAKAKWPVGNASGEARSWFFSSLASCLVGIEACATAHHWAREIRQFGHDVRLIPPAYVKPYVRRGAKNDAADAAAICEAVTRPNMRFVPIKSVENQGFLMLHRARGLLVRQRTMTACAIRAHFAEFGIIVGQDHNQR